MSKTSPRLGKGLSALIGPRAQATTKHTNAPKVSPPKTSETKNIIHELPLSRISPNPRQPRSHFDQNALAELAASLKNAGVLQPILVREISHGKYELVAGERRWRAAQIAQIETIPAIIRELSDNESFELALIENLQREDLGPLERAGAYQQLIDTLDINADELAVRLGESRPNVLNYLRLLKLDTTIQDMICAEELGMGQARAIAGISNPQRQLAVALMAVRRNLSVRQVEVLAKRDSEITQTHNPAPPRTAETHLANIQQAMSKALGLQVTLHPGKKKNSGRLVIRYDSLEEFDRIAEVIGGQSLME